MILVGWKSHLAFLILFAASPHLLAASQSDRTGPREALDTSNLAARVRKSLVVVLTQDREGNAIAEGSGFIFKPGLIATNLHVLKRASQGYVKFLSDGVSYKISSVVGFDLKHDICVLALVHPDGLPLALSADDVAVGEEILVAGNPEGLEGSFSKGIVSGVRADSGLIQMDAAISPGSSGGPVVNRCGEVVGLAVSSLVEGQNLNFAVPVRYLRTQSLKWNLGVGTVGGLAVTDFEQDGFHGHVKMVTEYSSRYTFDRATRSYVEGPAIAETASRYTQDGRLAEVTFFKDGVENGKQLLEYSDDGLRKRGVNIDNQGRRDSQEYSAEDAVTVQGAPFDTTMEVGTKGDRHFQIYKYDSSGHRTEMTFPQQGIKVVIKYDSSGREIDRLEYEQGKLESARHSTYQDNEHGDWTMRHETFWWADHPELGFTPSSNYHREISYY